METWFVIFISLSIAAILKFLLNLFFRTAAHKLPPGPPAFPIIGSSVWFTKSVFDIDALLRSLHSKFGPIITLYIGSRPSIFVADRFLTHQALVQNSAIFADRPPAIGMEEINSSNQHSISSASYGPTWRLLRRNLTAEILHHSRVKSYSDGRKWVLQILKNRLESESKSRGKIRANQENVLIPLIRARKQMKEQRINKDKGESKDVVSYIDTLVDLELLDEKRKLKEEEMVSLCLEFLNGGTDTTSTALQWIMANLVKYPQIQEKLFVEIKGVVGDGEEVIKEEDLQKMPYLKAVILEGLRRHPPAHMVVPHAVSEDTILDQYLVPKNGIINFMVAEIGWDSKVWKDPMEFKPERFVRSDDGDVFDIIGSKEVKMMPFGLGRRICPGYNLAILHLQYFVANLVWSYEWKAMEGDEIDLSEQLEFTVVMKYPLQACISRRSQIKHS